MAAVDSIITSVQQSQPQHVLNPELLTTVHLDLRGRRFHVDRDTLMNLPESVLLCLFPNGLVLSRVGGGGGGSQWSDGADNEEDEYLYVVDVSVAISTSLQGACPLSYSFLTSICSHYEYLPRFLVWMHYECALNITTTLST